MSSIPLTARFPHPAYGKSGLDTSWVEPKEYDNVRSEAVVAEDDSVMLDPAHMTIGRYYLAVVKQKPYIYRKISANEIEVYGLACED